MFANQVNQVRNFFNNESGQGLTEYGAVMAFTAMIVALAASLWRGSFQGAVQHCLVVVAQTLNQLAHS